MSGSSGREKKWRTDEAMDGLPLAVREHILLLDPLPAADLARAVMAGRCLHECLPGVVNVHAARLGVRLPRSRVSLTRWLNRATLEVARMRSIVCELEGAAQPIAKPGKLACEIQRMHPTVIEAQLPAMVPLMDRPGRAVVLAFLKANTSIRPKNLAPFVAPCVGLVEDNVHSDPYEALDALKILVRAPADAIVLFASALAACLGRCEASDSKWKWGCVQQIMIVLSNLPADALAPHAACIASCMPPCACISAGSTVTSHRTNVEGPP